MKSPWFAFALVILLTSCQTGQPMPPDTAEHLRGCWIEHRGKGAVTFRWFQDRAQPSIWNGEQIDYFQPPGNETRSAAWRIDAPFGRARLCMTAHGQTAKACWPLVFELADPSGGQDFASLKADRESLAIVLTETSQRTVVFAGVRDGCD